MFLNLSQHIEINLLLKELQKKCQWHKCHKNYSITLRIMNFTDRTEIQFNVLDEKSELMTFGDFKEISEYLNN